MVAVLTALTLLTLATVLVVWPANDNQNAPAIPFDFPPGAATGASDKLVFAHYFPPYPISLDNRPDAEDYYTREYLSPSGEDGIHRAYGGLIRERPLPRAVLDDPDWRLADMRTEVARAAAAGIDGFIVDLLDLTDDSPELLLRAAAEVAPDFRIVLMPDATGTAVDDPSTLAEYVGRLARTSDGLFRLEDGRLVVSAFFPESLGAQWWSRWLERMAGDEGIEVAFVPCFLTFDDETSAAFAPISYGFANWGDRSPTANRSLTEDIDRAHRAGRVWMQPVSLQDVRPAQGIWDEARNSENLRVTWQGALSGADWVQLVTWNDYAEGSEFAPSTHIGWGPLDISAYYLAWFKTGTAPTIVRDTLYLSHRAHPVGAPTSEQFSRLGLGSASAPSRDGVEILSFLTAPARITVRIGGRVHAYDAPEGVHAQVFPLELGTVSAAAARGDKLISEVRSPTTVVGDPRVQDLQYHFASSRRD